MSTLSKKYRRRRFRRVRELVNKCDIEDLKVSYEKDKKIVNIHLTLNQNGNPIWISAEIPDHLVNHKKGQFTLPGDWRRASQIREES